jgi:hypothetical protein
LNQSNELRDQRMSSLIIFKKARRGSMSDHFSPRDLSTYKQWLAKIAIAQSFENPTANIIVGSHKQ